MLVALVVNDGTLEGLFYRTPVRYSGVGSDDEGIEMSGSSVATGSNLAAATTYVMLRGFPMTRLALNLYKYRVRILTSIKAIVDYGKDKPWWESQNIGVENVSRLKPLWLNTKKAPQQSQWFRSTLPPVGVPKA